MAFVCYRVAHSTPLKRFDRKFKILFGKLNVEIELYRRYVDDITTAFKALDLGVRFNKEEKRMEKNCELV